MHVVKCLQKFEVGDKKYKNKTLKQIAKE